MDYIAVIIIGLLFAFGQAICSFIINAFVSALTKWKLKKIKKGVNVNGNK